MHADRNAEQVTRDAASSGSVTDSSDRPTLDAGTPERADGVIQALAEFGVPRSKRGARLHVVNNRASVSRTGRETAIANLAPDEWRPINVCSLTMDRALRELEFPSRLAGAEWVLGD